MTRMAPQPPVQPAPPMDAPPTPAKDRGLAVAAVVLGILTIIPFLGVLCGLAAIILGIISLATGRPGKGMAIAGIIIPLVLVPLLLVAILVPTLGRSMELARRSICGANLNSVGKGLSIYLAEHEQSPPDIDMLVRFGTSEKALVCPSDKNNRKRGYFFHFPTDEPVGNALVACDLKGNHGEDGRNVLMYMGSVRWIKGEAAFQAELALPHNADFAKALREAEGP